MHSGVEKRLSAWAPRPGLVLLLGQLRPLAGRPLLPGEGGESLQGLFANREDAERRLDRSEGILVQQRLRQAAPARIDRLADQRRDVAARPRKRREPSLQGFQGLLDVRQDFGDDGIDPGRHGRLLLTEQRLQAFHPRVQARAHLADRLELLGIEEVPLHHLIGRFQHALQGFGGIQDFLRLFPRRRKQRRFQVSAHALNDARQDLLRSPSARRVPAESERRLNDLGGAGQGAQDRRDSLANLRPESGAGIVPVRTERLELGQDARLDIGPPVAGRPAPETVAGEALPVIVDGVALGQNFRQLVVGIGPNLLAQRLQHHGTDRASDEPDQMPPVTAAHIDLAIEQVQEVKRPRVLAEAIVGAVRAAVTDPNVRPALVAEKLDLLQGRGGGRLELGPQHRIDPERIGQQQMANDLGGLGERLAGPPAQVIRHVNEHARPGAAADAAGDVHRRGPVGGQDKLLRLLLDDLLRARPQAAEPRGHSLVDDRLPQLEEHQASQPGDALAPIVGKGRVLPEAPHPVEVRMEFRIAGIVPHDLADIDEVEKIDEVGQNPLRWPAVIRRIGVQLQEADEGRDVSEQLAEVMLRPLAHQHAGAPQAHNQRGPHDDRIVAQSHSVILI